MLNVKTYPRILTISSDDWGGSEPPETAEDLARISMSLKKLKDAFENPPQFTAYFVAGGPDFDKVVHSNFQEYSWKFCYNTRPEMVPAWKDAISEGMWGMQFHGLEHSNVLLLMDLLRKDRFGFQQAFRDNHVPTRKDNEQNWFHMIESDPRLRYLGCAFIDATVYPPKAMPYHIQLAQVRQGKAEIERLFGVRLQVGTAPTYQWDTNTWKAFREVGLKYIETSPRQIERPWIGSSLKKTWHRAGYGKRYRNIKAIIRNVDYEPVWNEKYSWARGMDGPAALELCRKLLSRRAPVVISTHRLNYVDLPEEKKNTNCDGLRWILENLLTLEFIYC